MFVCFMYFMKCFSAAYEEVTSECIENVYEELTRERLEKDHAEVSKVYDENDYEKISELGLYTNPRDCIENLRFQIQTEKIITKNIVFSYDTSPFDLYESYSDISFRKIFQNIINFYEKNDLKTVLKRENETFNAKSKLFCILKSLKTSIFLLRKIPFVTDQYLIYNSKIFAFWYGLFYMNTKEQNKDGDFLHFSFQKQFYLENFIIIDCFLHKSDLFDIFNEFLSTNYKISLNKNLNYIEMIIEKALIENSDSTFLIAEELCKMASHNFSILFLSILTYFHWGSSTYRNSRIFLDQIARNEIIDIYKKLEIYLEDRINLINLVCLNIGWDVTCYLFNVYGLGVDTWFESYKLASQKCVIHFKLPFTKISFHVSDNIKNHLVILNSSITGLSRIHSELTKVKIRFLVYILMSLNLDPEDDELCIILKLYLTYGMVLYNLDSINLTDNLNLKNNNFINWLSYINSALNGFYHLRISVYTKFLCAKKLFTLILVMIISLEIDYKTKLNFQGLIEKLLISLKMHGFDICANLLKEDSEKLQNNRIFNDKFFPFYYNALVVCKNAGFEDFEVFLSNIADMKNLLFVNLSSELENEDVINLPKPHDREICWEKYSSHLRIVSKDFRNLENKYRNLTLIKFI
ncbi:hypothetical protein CWI38_0587p0030 [Hamiltosporidium tvaerminnensis]|uniref:Uncharacterized protein n=1 Tax=Hamiltosporidium tvaerminnensis TaxID=1176355 RepID=A0A4Q9LW08_9MICR|nr:hypothetical protein CWI38_0587p0030 [Hamiltosporidium tvaerminnensis]